MRHLGEILASACRPSTLRDRAPLILAALAIGSIGSLAAAVARSPEVMQKVDPLWQTIHTGIIQHSARAGLLLETITVVGLHYTQPDDILAAVGIHQGDPLLAMDPAETRARLENLPWIKHATIERLFPHSLRVTVIERMPIALFQADDGTYKLVDPDGKVIAGGYERFLHLPVVVGEGAPEAASDLLAMLNTQPDLAARIKAAVRFGGRRWDLWLDDFAPGGIQVHLPESQPEASLTRLAQLERDEQILERDVSVIDLRFDDRLLIRRPMVESDDDPEKDKEKTMDKATKLPQKNGALTPKAPISGAFAYPKKDEIPPPRAEISLRHHTQDA